MAANQDYQEVVMVDRFEGPLKDVIPERYHHYFSDNILDSYVVTNHKDANLLQERGVIPPENALLVTTQPNYDVVYPHIMENLTDVGQAFTSDVKPWIVNCLIDFADFDEIICSCPIQSQDPPSVLDANNNTGTEDICGESASSDSTSYKWGNKDTILLISLVKQEQDRLTNGRIKKSLIWSEIAAALIEKGYPTSPKQCESKWKNMKRCFIETEKHNAKSGNDRKDMPFYSDLADILSEKANVNPICTVESNSGVSVRGESESQSIKVLPSELSSCEASGESADISSSGKGKVVKKKKTPKKSNVSASLVLDYLKEVRQEDREIAERQHQERMLLFKSFIDVIKEKKN